SWAQSSSTSLMLAGEYRPGQHAALHLPDYWVSEKLDGVRARWYGRQLISRGGHPIAAPAWFTQGWPATALDGELWGGRGRFEATAGVAARVEPDEAAWKTLRFMVFDLPGHGGSFSERVAAMQEMQTRRVSPFLQMIEQRRGSTEVGLQQQLDQTVQAGGEGLMLHRGGALYQAGRSGDLLKFK
ncbi:DNA ligase, partial [Leptospira sp. SA-E8]|uniref:DNA ligase n=1 Tax=Leptospira sp. SA-E8 TaxID=3422259 RepID=UPI003EBB24C1